MKYIKGGVTVISVIENLKKVSYVISSQEYLDEKIKNSEKILSYEFISDEYSKIIQQEKINNKHIMNKFLGTELYSIIKSDKSLNEKLKILVLRLKPEKELNIKTIIAIKELINI